LTDRAQWQVVGFAMSNARTRFETTAIRLIDKKEELESAISDEGMAGFDRILEEVPAEKHRLEKEVFRNVQGYLRKLEPVATHEDFAKVDALWPIFQAKIDAIVNKADKQPIDAIVKKADKASKKTSKKKKKKKGNKKTVNWTLTTK
jgi:hypothetical protein